MGRSKETFGKKEVRNKQAKKRKEKEKRRQEKKEQGKSSFDDMLAWVDENGQISSTPPDISKKSEIDAESIEVSVPKSEETVRDKTLKGRIETFNESKGFGFIKCDLRESVFVHINDCLDEIRAGDMVEFETGRGTKGIKAINVKLIKP